MFRRFSGTAQSRFTPAPGGGYLFRPHGAFGRGYRVDEASKARIEKTLNRFYFWAILLLMLLVFAVWPFSAKLFPGQPKLGALAAALFVVAVGGVFVVTAYWLVARWACAGMQADAASLGVSGALAQRAAKVSAFRFQFLLAVSAVLVAACLWSLMRGVQREEIETIVLSALGVALFGLSAGLNLYSLRLKRRG